jgi:hypothetical protein
MANYDFRLAKQIIDSSKDLDSAALGMHEDWFWTADTVWTKAEKYSRELTSETTIGGIQGSNWATPVLELTFVDSTTKTFNCFPGMKGDELKSIEQQMMWASGVLSSPVQDYRDDIELQDVSKGN